VPRYLIPREDHRPRKAALHSITTAIQKTSDSGECDPEGKPEAHAVHHSPEGKAHVTEKQIIENKAADDRSVISQTPAFDRDDSGWRKKLWSVFQDVENPGTENSHHQLKQKHIEDGLRGKPIPGGFVDDPDGAGSIPYREQKAIGIDVEPGRAQKDRMH